MRLLHHGATKYRPSTVLGPACWPHFDLVAILGGGLVFDLPEAGLTAVAGDAVIVPRDVQFQGRTSVHGGIIWVQHFHPGKEDEWLRHLPGEKITHYPGALSGPWGQALLARIHEIHPQPELREEQTILFKMLLDKIRRASFSKKSSLIQKVICAAEEKQWRNVNVAWMAASAGLSQSHFRARFLAETGETAGAFLKNQRLERAGEMLRTTDLPIKEISQEAGYGEMSAFYHAFRIAEGCTPARFRKRHAKVV